MGGHISQCISGDPARIILLGLDASGKTTLLYKFLKSQETIDTFPTVGFNVEQITHNHLNMMLWDFGGRMIVRNLRRESFQDYDAMIFVVDSADKSTLLQAREELWGFLSFLPDVMEHTVILILANKQDVPGAISPEDLGKYLELKKLPAGTQCRIEGTSCVNGNGLVSSLNWLTKTIKENRRRNVTATYL